MATHSAVSSVALAFLFSGTLLLAQTDAPSQSATTPNNTIAAADQSDSVAHTGVRIVRLSQVKGDVLIDRNADEPGTGHFERAFANIPIIQGATLKTGTGVAEVEFEDNSSLRLTPDSMVRFADLHRDPSGLTASSVRVMQGTVFVSLSPVKGNQFTLTSVEGSFLVAPDSRIHFHEGSPETTVAVLEGSVQAQVTGTTTTATKKKAITFTPEAAATPTLVSHLDKTSYDEWDKQEVDYHKRYMSTAGFVVGSGTGTPVYGLSDMNYYGAFSGNGGCGNMWRPYLASAGWDPYSNGLMAYYPNAGYSWVSPYPWGWTPYHSGSWINCPGAGWGWQPGNTYTGLQNLASAAVLKQHGITVPPLPPKNGHSGLLAINTEPLHLSGFANRETFVFSKDSAGLGVPRETFGKLNNVSKGVLEHGAVTMPAHYESAVSHGEQAGHSVSFAHAGPNPSSGASRGSYSGGASASSSASSASSFSSASSHASSGASSNGGGAHH